MPLLDAVSHFRSMIYKLQSVVLLSLYMKSEVEIKASTV